MSNTTEILVSLGRVIYINFGHNAGKLAVIVDIIDGKRVVIDGPTTGIEKQVISNKRFALTRFRIPDVTKGIKQSELKSFKKEENNRIQTGREIQRLWFGKKDPKTNPKIRAD